jgi:hypothetical protein
MAWPVTRNALARAAKNAGFIVVFPIENSMD